ncbi:MAG: hypothetical protein SCK29_11190 [Bacillota bacterium]|nr:hypothetical protein [Bacillota bacterium]MDW7684669.1 hypothetical protein [Bacillota bacterium]
MKKKKSLPSYFWLGIILLYGYNLGFMFLEMNMPGMTYNLTIGGAPASWIYNAFMSSVVINIFLAWLWYYMPEQDDKRKQESQGGEQ